MKSIKKQIVLFMMFAIIFMPIQADQDTKELLSYLKIKDSQNSKQIHEYFENQQKQSYFQKVGHFWQTDAGISKTISIGVGLCTFIGLALFYIFLKQQSVDIVGNQTMQIYYPGDIKLKMDDVAGLSGAKADMQDIIDYFQNSRMYDKAGAKVPKGILMNGSPGNGKTLLAKAFAGQVNCPFISVSGSSFNQMYVGLGAARIRDLFIIAQKLAAQYGGCIVFIDEIDSVAQKRGSGGGGVEKDHDQTVAQLLQCMDGLEKNDNQIIIFGATNRIKSLDPAIVRPGRFDRIIEITKPKFKDRVELLNINFKTVKMAIDVDINRIARLTSGFSGASLSNLINESAILAANNNRIVIEMKDIELAFDNITLGREIKGMEFTYEDRLATAIHEAGHAAGWLFGKSKAYAIHKASITPRSHTLGIVHAIELHESGSLTETEMKAMIVVALCGGLAEQEFGFDKSTGVSNDLAKARAIAYDMVVKYGMSEELNYLSYDEIDHRLPNDIATQVHKAVQRIVDECFVIAKKLVADHRTDIEKIADLLMIKGTVLGDDIYQLVGLPLIALI